MRPRPKKGKIIPIDGYHRPRTGVPHDPIPATHTRTHVRRWYTIFQFLFDKAYWASVPAWKKVALFLLIQVVVTILYRIL